jgi:hypothetical protein
VNGTSPAPTPPAADVGGLDTLPKLLLRNATIYADRPAMRQHERVVATAEIEDLVSRRRPRHVEHPVRGPMPWVRPLRR